MVMDLNDPIVMLGYWNKPEKTCEKMHDGWFWTGDIGYQDAKGYVYFASRDDDMLKVAGMQVAAEEVEKALLSHGQVVEAGVCGIYDKQGEPSIATFIRLKSASAEPLVLADELRQLVRQRVAAHAYPRVVEFVRFFPMTSTGKTQRNELRRLYESDLVAQLR
jgi:acetyl-CoA synthetase